MAINAFFNMAYFLYEASALATRDGRFVERAVALLLARIRSFFRSRYRP
jgi:hypothetical protein